MHNFPQRGRGLGHVTSKIFGIRSNISSKLLELETSNLVHIFLLENPSGRSNNFPKGAWSWSRDPSIFWHTIEHIAKTAWGRDFNFGIPLLLGKAERRSNNFPQKGRGLGHVTPKICGKQSQISWKLLGLQTSNLVSSFACGMTSGCINNFPQRGVAGHVAPKFLAYD